MVWDPYSEFRVVSTTTEFSVPTTIKEVVTETMSTTVQPTMLAVVDISTAAPNRL